MSVWSELQGDLERGTRRLVGEYGDRLTAAAVLLCGDRTAADELVFRTFERVIAKIADYRPTGSFYGWLYTIMLNLRRMELRRKVETPVDPDELLEIPEREADDLSLCSLDAAQVRRGVDALPEHHREVVLLRYFEDLTVPEIAEILSLPEGTVMSRLYHARRALRRSLARQFGEGEETNRKRGEV